MGYIGSIYRMFGQYREGIENFVSVHIKQDIVDQKFSAQQIEWFWGTTEIHLDSYIRKGEIDRFKNLLLPILKCNNNLWLQEKAIEYCYYNGIEIINPRLPDNGESAPNIPEAPTPLDNAELDRLLGEAGLMEDADFF